MRPYTTTRAIRANRTAIGRYGFGMSWKAGYLYLCPMNTITAKLPRILASALQAKDRTNPLWNISIRCFGTCHLYDNHIDL